MLSGRSGGALLNATGEKNGFTHGQQVGWHGNEYALFSVITSDGRLILAGLQLNTGVVNSHDLAFIDACEWGKGKNMSQYFSQADGGAPIGNASSMGIKVQFNYPTQWYPGQTYPGTINTGVTNPTVNSGGGGNGGGGNSGGGGNGGGGNTGNNLLDNLTGKGGTTTTTTGGMNILVIVGIVAAVGALVYFLAKKK
jgi:hypothetical protein